MQGWEIAVLIIFILLIITGVILTIYFVWKHEQDQKKQTLSGGDGPTGATGPSGPSGASGATGSVPKNTPFSFYPKSLPSYWVSVSNSGSYYRDYVYAYDSKAYQSSPCLSWLWQYKDAVINGKTLTNTIEFLYDKPEKGFLFHSDSTASISIDGKVQTAYYIVIFPENNVSSNPSNSPVTTLGWIFKDSTICLQNFPNKCLYASSAYVSGGQPNLWLADNTNSSDPGFLWGTQNPPQPPLCAS